jgi:hypothetical protein
MTTAESFDPGRREEPAYLRVVQDGERAPAIDIDADGRASFARVLPDARGYDELPANDYPIELTHADLWARIARLEEDRETLAGRCDELGDRVERLEEVALRMRRILAPAEYDRDNWHLRAVVAQLRDLLR